MPEDLTAKLELVAEGNATQAVDALGNSLQGLLSKITLANAAWLAFAGTLGKLIQIGVTENLQMEKAVRVTTTLLETVYRYNAAEGEHAAATRDAVLAYNLLDKAQYAVMGSTEDLVKAYKLLLPAMAAAGETETPKMVAFTKLIAQLAEVTEQSYEGTAQAMSRMITTGQIARGPLGDLMRSLGITPGQLASWKSQNAVIDEMSKKLAPVQKNAEAAMESVAGLWSQIGKAFKDMLKGAEGNTFATMLQGILKDVRDFMVTIGRDGRVTLNRDLVEPLTAFLGTLATVVKDILRTVGSLFKDLGSDGKSTSETLTSAFVEMGKVITEVLGALRIGFRSLILVVKEAGTFIEVDTLAFQKMNAWVQLFNPARFTGGKMAKDLTTQFTLENAQKASAEYAKAKKAAEDLATSNNGVLAGMGKIVDEVNKEVKEATDLLDGLVAKMKNKAVGEALFPGLDTFLAGAGGGGGKTPRNLGGMNEQQEKALRNLTSWVAKLQIEMSKPGLEGYNKEMAELDIRVETVNAEFERRYADMVKEVGETQEMKDAVKLLGDAMAVLLGRYKEREGQRIFNENQRKLTLGLAEMNAAYQQDALARVGAERYAAEQTILIKMREHLILLGDEAEFEGQREQIRRTAQTALARIDEKARIDAGLMVAQRGKDWATYVKLLIEQNTLLGKSLVESTQEAFKAAASAAYASAETMKQGIVAAYLSITATLKTEGQIWADYLTGLASSVEKGFEDFVYSATHHFESLRDLLKGIYDSILRDFSKMVTEMVKQWLLGNETMYGSTSGFSSWLAKLFNKPFFDTTTGEHRVSGGTIDLTTNRTGGGNRPSGVGALGVLGGAATGLGVGSLIGGFSGAPGFSSGAAIGGLVGGALAVIVPAVGSWLAVTLGGATAGSAGGPLGTLIGAVIGAIVGGIIAILASPNTEAHIYGMDLTPQLKGVGEAMQASVMDIYTKSLLGDPTGFAKSARISIAAYLSKARTTMEVHAGSAEDIQADIQQLLTGVIPTELLHILMGQKRLGGRDIAGISGASKYGGELDPKAPLNQMLTDLGFTARKIQDLANQIDVVGAEEWLKQLDALVGLVVKVNKLRAEFGKSYAEFVKGWEAEEKKSPAELLKAQAEAVRNLLAGVANYSGPQAVERANAAIDATQQFFDNAVAAMKQLAAAAKQIRQEVDDTVKSIRDQLLTAGEAEAAQRARLSANEAALAEQTTYGGVADLWEKIKADFTALASTLIDRIRQIQGVLDAMGELRGMIASGPGANRQTNPFLWLAENATKINTAFAAMNEAAPGSQAQIDNAREFTLLVRDRYETELDLLERVRTMVRTIRDSIEQQIFDITLGEMSPSGQAGALEAEINRLISTMYGAQSPEELQSIVSRIQTLGGQYLGTFGANDPNRGAAVSWVTTMLQNVARIAGEIGQKWEGLLKIDIATLGARLQTAEVIMATALDAAKIDLEGLIAKFTAAGEVAAGKMEEFGQDIAQLLADLAPLLDTVKTQFTDLSTTLGGGEGGPDESPERRIRNLGLAATDAETALRALAGANAPANVNVGVSLNVDTSLDAEEIASSVYSSVFNALRQPGAGVPRY